MESKSDIKRMWSTLNSVIKSKSINAYPEEFEQVFVNIGPDLANKIIAPPNRHIHNFMNGKNEKSMYVEDVTTDEIAKIVNDFKNKMSCDVNCISMSILKKTYCNCTAIEVYM